MPVIYLKARFAYLPLPLPPAVASSFSSASSPGRKISCPLPFLTQYAATQPIDATDPTIHHAMPITPRSIHTPNHQPARIGPRVRKVAEQAWPRPCIVPKTEGCGDELLSRMMVAGRAKVRAATCKNNTKEIPSQTAAPEAGSGAFDVDGRSAMYGARKYAAGKRIKEPRKQRMRPNRALAHGLSLIHI